MKKWYLSKTVWFNVAGILGGSGALVAEFAEKGDFSIGAFCFLVMNLVNLILRLYTNQGIKY